MDETLHPREFWDFFAESPPPPPPHLAGLRSVTLQDRSEKQNLPLGQLHLPLVEGEGVALN